MKQEQNKKKLFNEILLEWLDEVKLAHAPSTYVKYNRLAENHIIPYFKGVEIHEINRNELNQYREFLRHSAIGDTNKKRSDGTVRCVLMIVNLVMKQAFDQGIITDIVNVTPGFRKRKTIVQVFSVEEQKLLERYLKNNWNYSAIGIYLSLYTGLRLGEICALKWENINVRDGYLHVRYTVQRLSVDAADNGKKTMLLLTPPKSDTSLRLVPIPSFFLPILRYFAEKASPNSFILTGSSKIPMEPRTLQYQYKRCLKEAGVQYLNFHALRHTFATRCITVGIDPKTLSEILGHSDIKITMDYYFHSSFEFKKTQIERLSAFA